MKYKVAVLGSGAFGTALSLVFYENKNDVIMWSKFEEEKEEILNNLENPKLKGIKIPKDLKITTNIEEAIKDADIIVIAVPAEFVDDISSEIKGKYKKGARFLIASKGIERDTCLFVEEILSKHIHTRNIAVISGPTFAIDIANKVPVAFSLGSKSRSTKKIIIDAMANDHVKLRPTKDYIGLEVCGSIKNVIAIAAGMLDGMGYPESTQAMFITESLHDLKNLIKALGGKKKTILSFAGFGDLMMTATSTKSRNYSFGRLLGEKRPREEIDKYLEETTVEGLYTLESIHTLLKRKEVDMPIIDLIKDIIEGKKDAEELVKFLSSK